MLRARLVLSGPSGVSRTRHHVCGQPCGHPTTWTQGSASVTVGMRPHAWHGPRLLKGLLRRLGSAS